EKRYIYNEYNRVRCGLARIEPTASWPYTLAGWRQAFNNPANKVEVMVGWAEDSIDIRVVANSWQPNTSVERFSGIGLDAVLAPVAGSQVGATSVPGNASGGQATIATYSGKPAVGLHAFTWLELSEAAGTSTFIGTGTAISGISGSWMY